jgi:hypothetical protein
MDLNLTQPNTLEATIDPNLDYKLVFPSSFSAKQREGWYLVREDAGEILGQSLILIARTHK